MKLNSSLWRFGPHNICLFSCLLSPARLTFFNWNKKFKSNKSTCFLLHETLYWNAYPLFDI